MDKPTPPQILIVDDDQPFVVALTRFLKGHGYSVLTAQDAMFAIQYVTKENISLLILDLGLPCGGGFFVLENLRKTRKIIQMPVIVSTANVSEGIEEETRNLGASDFIAKPYDLEKLLEMIKKNLS